MSLGPVTGNRFAGANKAEVKGNLRQRLADQVQRRTEQGTFKTGSDGRMEFVPKMAEQAFAPIAAPAGLAAAEAGVLTPSEAAQEFEPLRVGDKVQTLTGLVGFVVQVQGDYAAVHHAAWKWPATIKSQHLRLLQKAKV